MLRLNSQGEETVANGIFLLNPNWKTLVLISVNLAGLEIKMNMGNVMGSVK
jgi:hypothetical protein